MSAQATDPPPGPLPEPREPSPAVRKYQAAFGTAAVAGAFCLVVALSMLGRYWQEQRRHPLQSLLARDLDAARQKLLQGPTNRLLRDDIRRMDDALLGGYRRNQAFYDRGAYLLIGGAAVFLVAAGLATAARGKLPDPGEAPEGHDAHVTRWGRWALGGLVVLLLGGGGLLSLYSDELNYQAAAAPEVPQPGLATAVAVAPAVPVPPTTGPAIAPVPGVPHVEPAPPTNGWPRAATFPARAEVARQWNRFRGPGGLGHAGSVNVPLAFDGATGKNIAWKTEVPSHGFSSPVVWGDRVFVTAGTVEKRLVHGFDAASGKLLWSHTVAEIPDGKVPKSVTERMMEDTGYAACTAAADAERVYAAFATGEVVCLEHDGRKVWGRYLGPLETEYGHAGSLALHVVHQTKARVIVQLDQAMEEDGKSRLVVLDAATGKIDGSVTKRPVGSAWTTPTVIPAPGGDQIITLANPWVIAYAAANGKELWRAKCLEGDGGPSATYAAGLVLAGNTGSYMVALRPDGRGDVTKTKISWAFEQDIPDVCTPVADDKYLYMLTSDGLITCVDLQTGKKVYAHDLEMPFVASPVIVGDKLVVLGKKGVLVAGTRGPKFKELVRSKLGDVTQATPALVDGAMFLRGKKHLYCVREGAQLKVAPTTQPAPTTKTE